MSSTVTKKKVSDALKKVPSSRKGYNFKFIGICKDASALRKQTFPSSGGLAFEPKKDIWDVPRLLKHVMGQNAETQKTYLEYLEKELGHGLERSERSGRLTDEALASAAGRLLDVGTPPDVATLFPDAPTSTTRAVSTLSEQSRVLKELDEESRRRSRSLSSLLDGTQSRHLILAPPGCGKTYWLWREAKQTLDDGAWFPVHIPISRFSDWKHVEERVLETTGVELDSLLEHPKSLLVLDGLGEFQGTSDGRDAAGEGSKLQGAVVATVRSGRGLDPRFRPWELEPLTSRAVLHAIQIARPNSTPLSDTLLEFLRTPLALCLYLYSGGAAVSRGELLAQFHGHLAAETPADFSQALSLAASRVALLQGADRRSSTKLMQFLREEATALNVSDSESLLRKLGTLDTRRGLLVPIHDLYWSWLVGIGLVTGERLQESLPLLDTRESVGLAIESGTLVRSQQVESVCLTDVVFAGALSSHTEGSPGAMSSFSAELDTLSSDGRLAFQFRAAQAAFLAKRAERLEMALGTLTKVRLAGIYPADVGRLLNLDFLFEQRATLEDWLGQMGTDQLITEIAKRGDSRWGRWFEELALNERLPLLSAVAAALACEGTIPEWTRQHLPKLLDNKAYYLRDIAHRKANRNLAHWIAENYEHYAKPNSSAFLNLNSVLFECGDAGTFERLLERYPELSARDRELLAHGASELPEPWLSTFQRASLSFPIEYSEFSTKVVSELIDEPTARKWIASGHFVAGWRVLLRGQGNKAVEELVKQLPKTFNGAPSVPQLDALALAENPPESVTQEIWQRAEGRLEPRTTEQLIRALEAPLTTGIPSLVGRLSENPKFLPPYFFVKFLAALHKWQERTGIQFRRRQGTIDQSFAEWVVWERVYDDRHDKSFISRLGLVQGILPQALLAQFERDPELCGELIARTRSAGKYHKGLVEHYLDNGRASSIPQLFGDHLDSFPEQVLLRTLENIGPDFRALVMASVRAPSPAHRRYHEQLAQRALSGPIELQLYTAIAQLIATHSETTVVRLLKSTCSVEKDPDVWLIRETEKIIGKLLVDDHGQWLT